MATSKSNKCIFTDSVNAGTCKRCRRKFKMDDKHEYCCLEMCGELSACRNCKSGTRSDEYKNWRKLYDIRQ